MATYAYQCTDCENIFDIQATIQEKEEGKGAQFLCPKCKSANIRQKFSIIHFIKNAFKGDEKPESCCSDGDTNKKGCCS